MGGNVPKLFLPTGKTLMITTTVEACAACGFFDCLVVVTQPDYMVECKNAVGPEAIVVPGGKERQDSIANGLSAIGDCCPDLDYILIHAPEFVLMIDFAKSIAADAALTNP